MPIRFPVEVASARTRMNSSQPSPGLVKSVPGKKAARTRSRPAGPAGTGSGAGLSAPFAVFPEEKSVREAKSPGLAIAAARATTPPKLCPSRCTRCPAPQADAMAVTSPAKAPSP